MRHLSNGFSGGEVVWDADTLELVGYRYCSDDAGEGGACGPCMRWGSVELDRDLCVPSDPCARLAPPPTEHVPFCDKLGTDDEGWYWGDSRELIALAKCDGYGKRCDNTMWTEEGWRLFGSDGELPFVPDPMCHRAIGFAYEGEACGGGTHACVASYCRAPVDEGGYLVADATGVCAAEGSCSEDRDCLNRDNHFSPNCDSGGDRCEAGQCVDPNWPNCE